MDVQELNINNSTYDIKAKSVVDTNSGKVKMWTGTKAQYDAIVTKDADTLYNVTDDTEDPTKVRCRSIGEIVTSTIPIVDAGLHLLDGALLNGSGSYGDFVDYIADLYTQDPTANYFCTESAWQSSVSTYGSCGKFVYNSTNNTVRLPKVSDILQGTTDLTALGDLVQAGLPNIIGATGWITAAGANAVGSGAIYWKNISSNVTSRTSSSNIPDTLGFDASRSNSIYGNSSTVQPQTIKVLYYIVIANSTKTDIQVDIDEVATDLNGKADTDLSNISASQSAKNEILSWGMPDYSSGISVTWNTQYTAPTNGYIYATANSQSTYAYISINETSFRLVCSNGGHVNMASLFMEVSQGDAIKGTGGDNTQSIRFFPMKGVN